MLHFCALLVWLRLSQLRLFSFCLSVLRFFWHKRIKTLHRDQFVRLPSVQPCTCHLSVLLLLVPFTFHETVDVGSMTIWRKLTVSMDGQLSSMWHCEMVGWLGKLLLVIYHTILINILSSSIFMFTSISYTCTFLLDLYHLSFQAGYLPSSQ